LSKRVAIPEVSVDLLHRQAGEVLKIGPLAGKCPNFYAGLHQRACHSPADKSCRSGDEGFHA
jgi:hypothetical protein